MVEKVCTHRVLRKSSEGTKSNDTSETFVGAFAELAVSDLVLHPRIVASLGAYHEVQPRADNVVRWRPGVGVGTPHAAPISRHLSIGAEARAHLSGNGNAWFTMGLSERYRP